MRRHAEDASRLQEIMGAFHAGATTRAETHATVLLMWNAPLKVLHSSPSLGLCVAPPSPAESRPQRRRI